jgi:hypothetical protein
MPAACVTSTWVGAASIDAEGNVVAVRTIRPMAAIPPCRKIEDAFIAAIRQWKYEPTCVGGRPVKAEVTVAVHIDIR